MCDDSGCGCRCYSGIACLLARMALAINALTGMLTGTDGLHPQTYVTFTPPSNISNYDLFKVYSERLFIDTGTTLRAQKTITHNSLQDLSGVVAGSLPLSLRGSALTRYVPDSQTLTRRSSLAILSPFPQEHNLMPLIRA